MYYDEFGRFFSELEFANFPDKFKLKWIDAEKIIMSNNATPPIVIYPQDYNAAGILTADDYLHENNYRYRKGDDIEDATYFYEYDGNAVTGSGADEWIVGSEALASWMASTNNRLQKMVIKFRS